MSLRALCSCDCCDDGAVSIVGDVPQSLTVSGDEPSEPPKQSELPSPASADSRSKPGMSVGATVTLWRLESATLVVKARTVGGAAALATAVSKPLRLLRKRKRHPHRRARL